jgi:hypothetical protein
MKDKGLDDEQKLSEIKITSICLQVMNENAVRLALKHPPLPEEHLNNQYFQERERDQSRV